MREDELELLMETEEGKFDTITFDIKNTTGLSAQEIADGAKEAVGEYYTVVGFSHSAVKNDDVEYIHLTVEVEVDDESDLGIIESIINATQVFQDGVDVLNLEQEYTGSSAVGESFDGWEDDEVADDELIDDGEGLYADEEESPTYTQEEIADENEGLYDEELEEE